MSFPRIDRLAHAMQSSGFDAYFAQTPVSLGYLAGFPEDSHERFMTLAIHADGRHRLICPSLSAAQARRAGISDIASWADGEDSLALFASLAEEWGLRNGILAVDDHLPAAMLLGMQATLPAALFKAGQSVLAMVRSVKDAEELAAMRAAAKIADETYLEVLPQIRVGQTELEVETLLRDGMRKRGGKPTFCIVGVGAGSAEPHHLNGETKVAAGEVLLMDFGCEYLGYQSDITRCVSVGPASAEAKEVYDIVLRAHHAARAAILPGATGSDIDAAARKVIVEAGYGEQFFHRTGHGIGMEGHEAPNMVAGNDVPLQPGNCFSVEPGIYLEGKFGIRIENILFATETGHESFNDEPADSLAELPI